MRVKTGENMLHTVAELYEVFAIIRENRTKNRGKEGFSTSIRGENRFESGGNRLVTVASF